MLGLGLTSLIIVVPLTLVIRHKPEQYGYLPDGKIITDTSAVQHAMPKEAGDADISLGQALRSRIFWQLAIASLCFMIMANAYSTHIMPYYSSIGIARSTSSLIVSIGLLLGIIGALGIGWLGDKLDKRYAAAICFTSIILGLVTLAYVTDEAIVILVTHIIFFNIGVQGAVVMRSALLREYFGRMRFGGIIGLHNGIAMLGGIAGPFLAGWTFDNLGSYQIIWLVFAGLTVVSIVLVMSVPQRGMKKIAGVTSQSIRM
jgi:sugar phosphate permease